MITARQGALALAYPLALFLSQVVTLIAVAVASTPPYTMTIGWPLFGVVLAMALVAGFGAGLLAQLFRSNLPSGWRRIVLLWTAVFFVFAIVWALAMPPGILLEAVLVKPGGVWLIASAGALGFWQVASRQETRSPGPSI